jgi:hypothetical protein
MAGTLRPSKALTFPAVYLSDKYPDRSALCAATEAFGETDLAQTMCSRAAFRPQPDSPRAEVD